VTEGPFITILESLMPKIERSVGLRQFSISIGK